MMESKLSIIRQFQDEHPTSHVGGSIGLYLRGIDLKRDLSKSDLDITIDYFNDIPIGFDLIKETSDANDFDLCLKKNGVKIDLRINPEPSFDVIIFQEKQYNVSKLRDIIFWKEKYHKKGYSKHKNDLIVINGGERPIEKQDSTPLYDLDDLPF